MAKERIGLELRALNNLIRRYFEFSNGWIIGYLADHPDQDIFQKDIEDHFTIARSTASKVLTLMEQKGLIERQPVAQDARLKKIVLTDKTWKIREIMWMDADKLETTLVQGFREDEIDTLVSYLNRMKENISTYQEKK